MQNNEENRRILFSTKVDKMYDISVNDEIT
jgi:hypothetical protein